MRVSLAPLFPLLLASFAALAIFRAHSAQGSLSSSLSVAGAGPAVRGRGLASLGGRGLRGQDSRCRRGSLAANADATLYDIPVSNHGARVRMLIYAKGIEDKVKVESPQALGGIKGEEYLKLNPLGKMPILILDDDKTCIPESTVILHYLDSTYPDKSLTPATPAQRARSDLFAQAIDSYLTPIQGCMYRGPMEASIRASQLKDVRKYLDFLEHVLSDPTTIGAGAGPFCAGAEPSLGDIVAYPSVVFAEYMLPKKFGWNDVFENRPALKKWWEAMNAWQPAAKVHEEMTEALVKWDNDGRWVKVGIDDQVKSLQGLVWAY